MVTTGESIGKQEREAGGAWGMRNRNCPAIGYQHTRNPGSTVLDSCSVPVFTGP